MKPPGEFSWQTLIVELVFHVIWYCLHHTLALKWKIHNRKPSLDQGKETNKPKEERKDPFLCRKENKNTLLKATKVLPELSVLWLGIVLVSKFAGFACLTTGCCFALGYFARFIVFLFTAAVRCKTCCNAMLIQGNPDPLSLMLRGAAVPLVCGFIRRDNPLAWHKLFTNLYKLKSAVNKSRDMEHSRTSQNIRKL